jgi:hypothetical protein
MGNTFMSDYSFQWRWQDAKEMEARLVAWYRREIAVVNNERMPEHWRRQSMEACQEITNVLGYEPVEDRDNG